MNIQQNTVNRIITSKFVKTDRQLAYVLILLVIAFVVLTLAQDFLRSNLNISPFYFAESFMFSSFWWLFAPCLFTQYFAVKNKNEKRLIFKIAVIILPVFFHLLAFPFLVWVLSSIFYYHAFSFQQTVRYTLS